MSELVVVTGCALHDAHNAFRWSMLQQFSDRNLQRNCYVAIEALRKSIDALWGQLDTWVAQRLTFRDPQDEDWVEEQEVLWETLGVDPETCHSLAKVLQY
eukprot:11009077-Lingulodinium_polyedra.AAC.1